MSVVALLDRAVSPLDAARRAAWGFARRHRPLARLVARREARLPLAATAQALVALLLAIVAPTLLLVLGPLLLGVPHVAADVRYLVLRRELPRGAPVGILVFSVVLVGLRILSEAGLLPGNVDRPELAVAAAWVGTALLMAAAEAPGQRRALLGAILLALVAGLALAYPRTARLVFLHLHNVVAIALWATVFRRRFATLALPLGVVLAGVTLLASGATWGVTLHHGVPHAFGLHVLAAADWVAPGVRTDVAVGLTSAYVFLQSVHYAVWLLWVPQDDARGTGLSSFRTSLRGLVRDFGAVGLAVIAVAALTVLAGASWGAVRAQRLYFSFAMFHGYLELAVGAYFWARGAPAPRARP